MRRVVLSSLFDHLEQRFGVEWSRDTFVDGSLSLPQIDALLEREGLKKPANANSKPANKQRPHKKRSLRP